MGNIDCNIHLFIAAFSGSDLHSGDSAFRVLTQIWSGPFPETDNIFCLISFALIRLGGSPAILEAMGWATAEASDEFVNQDGRAVATYRLVMLLKLASW